MASSSSAIPKGSETDRAIWRDWAYKNHLADKNGIFLHKTIDECRASFRLGLREKDVHLLDAIEHELINVVHFRNSVTERWPETVRIMLNRIYVGAQDVNPTPFDSWYGPPGLEKRKQATRVWTELIMFLVLEYQIHNITWINDDTLQMKGPGGGLPDMGLHLSEDMGDDIVDMVNGQLYGPTFMKNAVHQMCLSLVMHRCTTPSHSPLLFWVGLILQTEEFGEQSRFTFNGIEDTLCTREKLEALVHYARVLILDHAYMSWLESVSDEWREALELAVNRSGRSWVDKGEPRPADLQGDPDDIGEPFWRAFIEHFDKLSKKWIVKDSRSPIGVILKLLDAQGQAV